MSPPHKLLERAATGTANASRTWALIPKGCSDNSPMLQLWVSNVRRQASPDGTADSADLASPSTSAVSSPGLKIGTRLDFKILAALAETATLRPHSLRFADQLTEILPLPLGVGRGEGNWTDYFLHLSNPL